MKLKDKVAIVTGGGRDIGLACVMKLAREGAKVAINYHSTKAGAEKAVEDIKAAGGDAFAMQGDMTNERDVKALISATVEHWSKIDILMPVTGGIVKRVKLAEMSLDHWDAVMDINAKSCFLAIRECLPHMGQGSAIVTFASQAGRDGGGSGSSAYAASKGAIMTLTRSLAKELGPDIRVNSVCPGMIDTDFHNIFTKPEVRKTVANAAPLKREGLPEDVANLAVYLASDEAAYLTGVNVDINGGMLFS